MPAYGKNLSPAETTALVAFLETLHPAGQPAARDASRDVVLGQEVILPLAGPANRQGRIAATNALGGHMRYGGAIVSSVVKVFDATAASTGLSEAAARAAGFNVGQAVVVKDHHAAYFPGAKERVLKVVYDRADGRLLGGQAFGEEGVEKRIDTLAVALHGGMTLDDLAEVDLAYAPPYSSANDPLNVAGFVGQNDLDGYAPLVSALQVRELMAGPGQPEADGSGPREPLPEADRLGRQREADESGRQRPEADEPRRPELRPVLLDVRNLNEYETSHVRGALHIPLDELRFRLDEVPRNRPVIVQCRSGYRAHLALRILKEKGWADVRNVTGGLVAMSALGGFEMEG